MIFYAYFFCCLSQNNYLCTLIFSLLLNMRSHPTWVRGLKHLFYHRLKVAQKSHPTWVRGLKHHHKRGPHDNVESHPTWVRGLKHDQKSVTLLRQSVAPYVGAWIETYLICNCLKTAASRTLRGCVD